MSNFTLSIALVTRNRPQCLRRCLESWRAQSVQPFEIVVSDDSDDDAQKEVSKIASEFDARWIAGPRRGLYANRNCAFYAARGSHVMSADDDHTHPPEFVRTVLAAIESDPDAVWTFSERSPGTSLEALLPIPGELRDDGTVGPPRNPKASAAIACGSSVYPRRVFERGLRCDETYRFGGIWYLWGHQLRRAGFRIHFCPDTFVWHHVESWLARRNDLGWMKRQLECNYFVQAVHALKISRHPAAILRLISGAGRLLAVGGQICGLERRIRLSPVAIVRALERAFRKELK